MKSVAERFIQLEAIRYYRPLTELESREYRESQRYLINLEWKKALLKNFSMMAYATRDWNWLHGICAELDRLEGR